MKRFSFFEAPIVTPDAVPAASYTLADVYNCITGQFYHLKISTLRSISDKHDSSIYKKKELDYVTFSGLFTTRKSSNLLKHSGYLCLDFDNLDDPKESKKIIASDKNISPLLLFISPSGHGLKVVVPINIKWASQAGYVDAFAWYFRKEYGMKLDTTCKDVCRACFLSYDPEAIYREDVSSNCFDPRKYLHDKHDSDFYSASDDIEELIQRVMISHIDITPTYEIWRNVGFGLANSFGEAGREYFQQISRFYPGYTQEETDRQYTACLRSKGSGITIASVYKAAKDAGIDISLSKNMSAYHAYCAHEENKSELFPLPTIPKKLFDDLPRILQQVVSRAQDEKERDVCLLSAVTIMSAALPHICGVYDGKVYFPHLYIIIEGPASSGKGRVSMMRCIGDCIHQQYKQDYDKKMAEYKKQLKEWKESEMDEPEPIAPRLKLFYIPANSTSTALCRQLADNNGEAAIIDTEVDTVVNAFCSDYGNYSEILRKAAHHETISYRRRTNDEFVEIDNPKISLCLAGTPNQVNALMGNGEDGLFSRVSFYHLPLDLVWRDPFRDIDSPLESLFKNLGETFFHDYYCPMLQSEGAKFSFSIEQQDRFNQDFTTLLTSSYDDLGDDIVPTVHRLGLVCFRMAMLFTTLRAIEQNSIPQGTIICDDLSFDTALEICKVLLSHDMYIYSGLPRSSRDIFNRNRNRFLESLPETFDRKTYQHVAKTLGMNIRTVDRYVRQLQKERKIKRVDLDNYVKNESHEKA